MTTRNLADPAFEPSDEDLRELARNAFSHIKLAEQHRLERLRQAIAEERARVLLALRSQGTL